MASELAFALINPYTIAKSRTGGVIGRLMSRTGLELAAARLYGPSRKLSEDYAESLRSEHPDPEIGRMLADYVSRTYTPEAETGHARRVMLLLFEGENAIQKVREATGHIRANWNGGETIRDTYGDYIMDPDGRVRYFEPAVLVGPTIERAAKVQWGLMICVYCLSHVPALLTLEIAGYEGRNALLIVFLILTTQSSDVFQYVWGKLIGKRKISVAISPSKTLEGLVGGVLTSTAVGAALWWITPFAPWQAGLIALTINIMGFFGGSILATAVKP